MAPRRTPRPGRPGRRTRLLEPGVQKKLIDATRLGAPIRLAADSAGISSRAFEQWMRRGHDEDARQDEGEAVDPVEEPYRRLYREVLLARSEAGVRNVGYLQKAAAGGYITEETVETLPGGHTRKTTKRAAPDWRAASFYLERSHRAEFGKEATQVEILGGGASAPAGGGGDVGDLAAELARRVRENLAAITAAPAGEEDVVDADVLDTTP